ncbi:hypothetical protein CDCA_CDCA13G3613 [Cyanidium caldarium]|uniref:Uncharacterized protein n=1 Tax=Cyanidium caldarium TaxID=2771 RepID=A0AAV9J0P1_CYACA|nr:hypothetical protein CDCA_CDCA13G3613 [Cyanidium caldarium]
MFIALAGRAALSRRLEARVGILAATRVTAWPRSHWERNCKLRFRAGRGRRGQLRASLGGEATPAAWLGTTAPASAAWWWRLVAEGVGEAPREPSYAETFWAGFLVMGVVVVLTVVAASLAARDPSLLEGPDSVSRGDASASDQGRGASSKPPAAMGSRSGDANAEEEDDDWV